MESSVEADQLIRIRMIMIIWSISAGSLEETQPFEQRLFFDYLIGITYKKVHEGDKEEGAQSTILGPDAACQAVNVKVLRPFTSHLRKQPNPRNLPPRFYLMLPLTI